MPVRSRRATAHAALLALAVIASLFVIAPAGASSDPGPAAPLVHPRVERDLYELGATDPYGAFVHFDSGSAADQARMLTSKGMQVTATFPAVDVVFAVGSVARFRGLLDEPAVFYLEPDRRLQRLGDTGPWATRARVAQQNVSGGPYLDAAGAVLNGSGVGVAVVDSGINSLHPDLANRVVRNFKIVCSTPFLINTNTGMCFGPIATIETRHTDITGGHGTHVAGIVAGDGTVSQGHVKGVAPGASLFGYGTGEVTSILTAAEAFQHILTNYATLTPRIRVVNNSWGDGAGSTYDPNSVLSKLTKSLVDKGVTVVYAAGNGGGNGSADRQSSTAKDPTPGVITVANYDDADLGTRSGQLNSSSSRAKSGEHSNYPDISAPGTNINSPCIQAVQPVCNAGRINPEWQPFYSDLSGTSMAAPHVAGIAAMLYQARPELTPAQVEDVLQDTALKFTFGGPYESDPQNPGGTTSFDKGAGLVDVPNALRALGLSGFGVSPSSVEITAGDGNDFPGPGAADLVSVSASNEVGGMRYRVVVRDADDVGPSGSVGLRVTQNVDGKAFTTSVNVTRTGAAAAGADPARNSAPASEVSVDLPSNTVAFLVPYSALGDPPANSPGHNAFASSFIQGVVDVAPGGPGADALIRPRSGAPYTVKPEAVTDPDPGPTETATPTPTETVEPTPTETDPGGGGGGGGTRGAYPEAPSDPYFPDVSDLFAPQQWAPQKIQAPLAWQEQQATGFNVNVAVLDSGVDLQHADLQCPGKLRVVPGSDVVNDGKGPDDIDGHGTHVAGIIGACTNNGTGIAGVAPDSTIMPFQIFSAEGGAIDDIVTGIRAATDAGAHVINMSLSVGVAGLPGTGAVGWLPELLPEVDEAIEYANSKGVVVVAAAGNSSLPLCEYPAIAEDVICVGATDNRDLKTWYSGFPNKPDLGPAVVAPGGNEVVFCNVNSESIFSLYPEELDTCNEGAKGYRSINGTSMASPHVAGVAALVYDRLNAERTPENRGIVVNAIVDSATDLGTPGYDRVFGYGRVDALAAVGAVEPVTSPPTTAATTLSFVDTPTEAQHSDAVTIAARLTETDDGAAVAGKELAFLLEGPNGSREWTATTDETGGAGGPENINELPGSYSLTVRFAGTDTHVASVDVIPVFIVSKDDSTTALEVIGDRNNRQLTSTTTDADSAAGLGGVLVTFYADGVELASATTTGAGTATIEVAKKFTKRNTTYEVIFGGSDTYLGSSAQQRV